MKFARLLLFFSLALSLRLALAQSNARPAPATPIRYSSAIPKSVLKLMPRGAKSLFWGTFSPKKGSARMAIHLFHPDEPELRENHWRLNFVLDVFDLSHRFRRINRIPVTFSPSFEQVGPLFDFQLFWLRQTEQTQPVFKIRCFDTKGWAGEIGDDVVIVLPQGWKEKAVTQSWFWGAAGGPDPDCSSWQYNDMVLDATGKLQINARQYGGQAVGIGGLFVWNGTKWVVK